MRLRPEAASRDDNREKFTTAQYLNYTRRRCAWFCIRFTDTDSPASASTGAS
ncbi:hypothetical protein SMX26_003555 [Cronobacter universalis]|nr:hypothetical protein [Cronobacter universalis]